MNEPKVLISIRKGVAYIHGATQDMKIYLVDWDEEEFHEEEHPDQTFAERMLEDWCNPSEIIEEDFEKYVENYINENTHDKF